jgi:hypothetical protein
VRSHSEAEGVNVNGRKAKAIRREIRRLFPRGVGDAYLTNSKQRINPMRQAKKKAKEALA